MGYLNGKHKPVVMYHAYVWKCSNPISSVLYSDMFTQPLLRQSIQIRPRENEEGRNWREACESKTPTQIIAYDPLRYEGTSIYAFSFTFLCCKPIRSTGSPGFKHYCFPFNGSNLPPCKWRISELTVQWEWLPYGVMQGITHVLHYAALGKVTTLGQGEIIIMQTPRGSTTS